MQGVKRSKRSGETDKFIRFKNTTDSEKVAHKAKATERYVAGWSDWRALYGSPGA